MIELGKNKIRTHIVHLAIFIICNEDCNTCTSK